MALVRRRPARGRLWLSTVAVASITLVTAAPARGERAEGRGGERERTIVALTEGAGPPVAVARDHERRYGVRVLGVYEHALRGYVAEVPAGATSGVVHDPRVAFVERDQVVHAFAQTLPTGLNRIEADENPTAAIDGGGRGVDVDIAVIDTGIHAGHPDLNVAGGTSCTSFLGLFPSCGGGSFADDNGHGTHVAGTAAAKDDGNGVVGVAPGARLWAVKALDASGSGFLSQIVAAIDWVTANAGTIEVANMSLGAEGASRSMTTAISRSTRAGVVYAVAAGNSAKDAATFIPANHPEVIAVSAMADFNGLPGGGAPATCRTDVDDTFADFSNFGEVVDLAAPGVCILSTWNDGGYTTISGTSMASPHAAGAAALYIAANRVPKSSTRWSTVRTGLTTAWSVAQGTACGFSGGRSAERMLLVADC